MEMLGLIFAVFLHSTFQSAQPGVVFTTVAGGANSFIDTERTVVVRTDAEWDALWKEHGPDRPRPNVDFKKDIVVGVFLGTRPTGGYSVAVTSVRTSNGVTTVQYAERRPAPGLMLVQALTMPFQLVRIPATAGKIEFRKTP